MSRKEKEKFHFIYKTTNIKNGKFYIGMHTTSNLYDGYLGSGDRIRSSVRHHGKECHVREILEFLPNRDALAKREREIVNEEMLMDPMCMNLMIGGKGGWSHEQQIKGSILGNIRNRILNTFGKRLKNDPEFAKEFSKKCSDRFKDPEYKKNYISKTRFTNKIHSSETKEKMRISHSGLHQGKKNSQFGKCWITKENEDKKIKSTELDYYFSLGWSRGRNKNCFKRKNT